MTNKDIRRYERHIQLDEVGVEGQQKILEAKVLVVGAGGLGCPVLIYLAAAGVGNIGIVDCDIVSENNLQRQILYNLADVGKHKAIVAKEKIVNQNPDCNVEVFNTFVNSYNIEKIAENYDIIVAATDNYESRYLIDDLCGKTDKIMVFGSIKEYEGQVSVFNYNNGPSYSDLFPDIPLDWDKKPATGVIGVLPGITGTIMAAEVIKVILEMGDVMSGKLMVFDMNSIAYNVMQFN